MIDSDNRSNLSDVLATALVISWNTRDLLRECLASLEAVAKTVPLQIIVVDNASEDGSADMVAEVFPQAELIRNDYNAGFGVANNIGFKCARGRYLLLLNPDALFDDPPALTSWIAAMESDPRIAASGAYLIDGEGRHRLGDAGFRPTWRSIVGLYWFLGRLIPNWFPPYCLAQQSATCVDVDWVSGAAMLVLRSRLDDVGGFDERIFMYGEDVEWCCRMRDSGYRVVHFPSIRITHFEGASGRKQQRPGYSYLWFRQMRALYFYYQPRQPAWIFDVILLVGLGVRVAGYGAMRLLNNNEFSRNRIRQHLTCMGFLCRQFGRRGEAWSGQRVGQ